jgi:ribosomal peptide maturation radical SAM protein 1
MYKVTLINMPFATVRLPSIALTQLKSVLEDELGDRVAVRLLYLNHDFAHLLGLRLYSEMSDSLEANMCGLGDWFFRGIAFPELPDNAEDYLQRYFPQRDEAFELRKRLLLGKRQGLPGAMARLIAKYRLADDDLVGFTSMFSQNVACIAMARKLKEKNPAIVTVLGGANCEAPMGGHIAAHVEPIDFVFSGPSLRSFPRLVGFLMAGERDSCHDIQGVFSRRNFAPEKLRGPQSIGEEVDIDVPVRLDYGPFLDTFERSFADAPVKPVLLFETSRGCWWGERSHCTFCGLNGTTMRYRRMNAERAREQLERMFELYGGRCSRYESVDNIMPREYLKELFPYLRPPSDVSLFYEVKADLKAHEMEVLAQARVVDLQPGIESLATSTLKLMRKGTTSFQNINFMKNCVIYGIKPQWNLLLGFPGETGEVYEKYVADIPSLLHLPPPSGAFPVRFDRFSPYFMQAAEYGLELEPSDFYSFIYPFPREVLAEMIYFFVDRRYASIYLATMSEWRDRIQEQVDRWHRRWSAEDGGLPPALYLDVPAAAGAAAGGAADGAPEAGVVHDTRSGSVERHDLGALGIRALRFMAIPRKREDLGQHLAGADADGLLADLVRRRLVFVERELYLGLPLTGPASAA